MLKAKGCIAAVLYWADEEGGSGGNGLPLPIFLLLPAARGHFAFRETGPFLRKQPIFWRGLSARISVHGKKRFSLCLLDMRKP